LISQAFAAPHLRAPIIDGQNNHNCKAATPVLQKILETTGRFQVDALTTPPKGGDFSGFHPEFSKYQVVISNYTISAADSSLTTRPITPSPTGRLTT
jgi:hypothetical protein